MRPRLPKHRLCLLFFLFPFVAIAQKTPGEVAEQKARITADDRVLTVAFSEERQTPSLIRFKEVPVSTSNVMEILQDFLALRPAVDQMIPVKASDLPGELSTLQFQQYFKGVKVEHGSFKALVKGSDIRFMNGSYYDVPLNMSVTPSISEQDALGFAKRKMPASKYAWEELEERIRQTADARQRAALESEREKYLPGGHLVIVKDFNERGRAIARLAYKFNIYAFEPLGRAWVYVDAANGRILLKDDVIKHLENTGPGNPASVSATVQTRYAGIQTIKTKLISGNDPNSSLLLTASNPTELYVPGSATYALIDDTRGNGIETYDLNGVGGVPLSLGAIYLQGKSFTDADNNWTYAEHHRSLTNGGAAEVENDDLAWDAHWGAEVVYDYWLEKHNRRSYDGNDAKIKSFIHYGSAYDNAFWNGEAMTYGDGALYKALVSLDVVGHEIGHGVCSNTSDLVYERESGAMNEALSDIWAACIEHYAMTRSGSTVPSSAFRPFYIGEQIAANPNSPLRRMDNPKAKTDPDTYGGQYWSDPGCVPEQNTNDNCGVHTNSGVLNHWFFLLTAGSRTGNRPPGMNPDQYYFSDSDDEINDHGNSYRVNGVGFDVSEKITFMMETMLSSTATYQEAREVSIAAAIELSGDPCSPVVESVTNAWFAVGVGAQFDPVCAPTFGFFGASATTVTEKSITAGCASQKTISLPLILPAGATANITSTGTALTGRDYSHPATVTNSNAVVAKVYLPVQIMNDAVIEGDETIAISISISNTGSNAVNTHHVITINDDDVLPVIGSGSRQLLQETFSIADGPAGPSGWRTVVEIPMDESDPTAFKGHNHWEIAGGKLVISGMEPLTKIALPGGNYYNNSESRTLVQTPLIDATGLGSVRLHFDYRVQGEVDPQKINPGAPDIETLPVFDYMAILYSTDGVNWTEINHAGFRRFASAAPQSGTFDALLPPGLANKKFYLAFRWYNDTNAGGPESVQVDNVGVMGSPITLENDPGHNSRENLDGLADIYFYSVQDGQVIGYVKNSSSKDFGCTNLFVERSGGDAFNLYQGRDGIHKVAGKIIRIEPSFSYKGNNSITIYFSEEQVEALELATGRSRTEFYVYKVSAAAYSQAATTNTKKYSPVITSFNGVVSFQTSLSNDYLHGSYAIGYPVTLLDGPATAKETGTVAQGWKFSPVFPNPGRRLIQVDVTAPGYQLVNVELVNSLGQVVEKRRESINTGTLRLSMNMERLPAGTYTLRFMGSDGLILNKQTVLKH